ncbi:MAG: RelA/SpoT domain-containing protein [Acidobacteria bacterium]|nr:RelA/SpoT domain-containing protein [Acidobacteriota bacterium]
MRRWFAEHAIDPARFIFLQNLWPGTLAEPGPMAFVLPRFQRREVNRAGAILASDLADEPKDWDEWGWAYEVLSNWRACHGYPINTFQATLRQKLRTIDKNAIVAQRLKRAPSVIAKLQRFPTMKLAQMQDIGGLRAVVSSVARVRPLEASYRQSSFKHELASSKDYIDTPKADGYRSIHLVYRYANNRAPAYNDLLLELQLRTRLQHAWATAVETMGTFLGQVLKSGQGERPWREFFEVASAALTHVERTPPVPGYANLSREDVFARVARADANLHILTRLRGFSIAADRITAERGAGSYHLVVLDSANRSVLIRPFPTTQLEQANLEYAKIEERAQRGEQVEAVLVSAGPIQTLRKAYPNYFLDTHEFVAQMERIIAEASGKGNVNRASDRTRRTA